MQKTEKRKDCTFAEATGWLLVAERLLFFLRGNGGGLIDQPANGPEIEPKPPK